MIPKNEIIKLSENIIVQKDNFFISSRDVAEKFGKEHRTVLRNIYSLLEDIGNVGDTDNFNLHNFKRHLFKDNKGRSYPEFLMTRDGFSLLAMGFTGKEAREWKIKFIKAFNLVEQQLLKQQRHKSKVEWSAVREQGKEIRRECTDVIQQFVEYAKKQGSEHAEWYYKHVTNMEYKALELMEHNNFVGYNFRDTLNSLQLSSLLMAEQIATQWFIRGMEEKLHYKDIFMLVKDKVVSYAQIVCLPIKNKQPIVLPDKPVKKGRKLKSK